LPEDILISKDSIDSSARNSFSGVLAEVTRIKSTVKLIIDTGIPFHVVLTKRAHDDMGLFPGSEIYLTFKASATHTVQNDARQGSKKLKKDEAT
jgi:molybdate transport system ATP-binding protein/molybdate/tungstate transport system ATP-binding protein